MKKKRSEKSNQKGFFLVLLECFCRKLRSKENRERRESRINGASVSSSGTVCCDMLLYAEELGIMASKDC